jgi:ribA/ribD-fused uncharacterized protein
MAPKATIADLQHEIKEQNKEIQNLKEKVEEILPFKNKCEELKDEIEQLKSANISLKKRQDELNEKNIALELYGRRENLIFEGIDRLDHEDCWTKVKHAMVSKLKLPNDFVNSIQIQRCHPLYGKVQSRSKQSRIIVRFVSFQDREKVWSARFNLTGSGIFLNEDFPTEILNRRKALFPIMKKAKSLGKKAILKNDQLFIDSVRYTVNTLQNLPRELDPAELATRRSDDITAFFSAATPLSNFYQTEIKIDNHVYHSVEQYLQLCKAQFAQDINSITRIRQASHPAACKSIGDRIVIEMKEWIPQAKTALHKACLAKFSQDARAKNFLLETRNTTLAEATRSKIWGIGMTLNDTEIFDRAKWGQNIVGKLLMEIRTSLQ